MSDVYRERDIDLEFIKEIEDFLNKEIVVDEEGISIDTIVKLIRAHIKRGDIFSILIQGLSGHGKTTLALMISARFYSRKTGGYNWNSALRNLYFDPLEILKDLLRSGRGKKLIVFDDAGAWLSKWALTVDKRFFLEFSNLLRTTVGCIIYTDIWSVQKYIRDTSKMRILVRKLSKNEIEGMGLDTDKEWSRARIYYSFLRLDGVYYKRIGEIIYPLALPQRVRRKYKERRDAYTRKLIMRTIKAIQKSRVPEEREELLNEILEEIEARVNG